MDLASVVTFLFVLRDIAVFLLVLGLLVFFHELGHFIAAKLCGIYVDRFSLGMPPRLIGVRLGETDYCLGALPFGGYVKMAGQEDAPLSDEERETTYGKVPPERWFGKKPVWQRFIVIFAGPAMNFVLAILLYATVAFVGARVPEYEVDTRIGPVVENSPAGTAAMYRAPDPGVSVDYSQPPDTIGWKTGDRIVSINGNRIRSVIVDAAMDAALGKGETMRVVLERPERDGAYTRYVALVEPAQIRESDPHVRFGVGPFQTVLAEKIVEGSPAEKAGLKPGDIITRADGNIVDKTTFIQTTARTPEGEILTLEIERDGQRFTQTVQPETIGRLQGVAVAASGGEGSSPVVDFVTDDYAKAGQLQAGDIIEEIEGQPATIALLTELEHARPGGSMSIRVRRPGVMMGVLRDEQKFAAELPVASVRAIGVELARERYVFARVPPARVLPEAFRQAHQALERTVKTVVMLVQGDLSPKDLGGPVMIYQVTTTAAREGFWWLFGITAFISVNLCVFNLLPFPVLDGGLLMYLLIEGIRGKPLSPKVQERMQQVGLLLIVCLFLLITYNDIARIVTNSLGG